MTPEPLILRGIRPGDPAWVLPPLLGTAVPDYVASAVLVREGDQVKLLHADKLHGYLDVYCTPEEAEWDAECRARHSVRFHREGLARAEQVLRELGAKEEEP